MRPPMLGVLLFAAVPLTLAFANGSSTGGVATREVTIDARCTGGENTTVTLRPWNLKIRQGDDVAWVLNANANSDDITVTPKRGDWPFADQPPYRGGKARPAQAGGMRPNARGRYSYNVTLVCTNGQQADTVVIDPDIIVD